MRKANDNLIFSPSDLTNFVENDFTSWMDRFHLEFPDKCEPDDPTEEVEIILKRGLEHEQQCLERLRTEGLDICEIPYCPESPELTLTAMDQGREIIYQASLEHDHFSGYADFLIRVHEASKLGDHGYEVWDAKLSLKAKPYFVIQLCCYAEILEATQGCRPNRIAVVLGDGSVKHFRTDDFFYYYLHLKEGFLEQQRDFDPRHRPEPLAEGKNGHWETIAKKWLEENDHLSMIAGITQLQIQRLRQAGIDTVKALGSSAVSLTVPKMRSDTLQKLQAQARLQVAYRGLKRPKFEVIPQDPEDPQRGLALLPPRSELDVFLDLEGYPLIEGGLEYLFGSVYHSEGKLKYRDWWAHNPVEERKAFKNVVDFLYECWQRDPGMHIYHYAPYEVTALRRLMGKYATREEEVDDLLRNQVFVDLYKVLRQGLRIGVPSYSLKEVEGLYLERRETDVATAVQSIVFYERWLEAQDRSTWRDSKILSDIRTYNREDCESAWKLAGWLRTIQKDHDITYLPPATEDKKEDVPERKIASLLAQRLLQAIPEDRSGDPERWRVQELLAWLLGFHRREEKPTWWAVFERWEMTEEELWDDLDCLAGLVRTGRSPERVKQSILYEYRFDADQDTKIKKGDTCLLAQFHELDVNVRVEELNLEEGRILLRMGPKAQAKLDGAELPKKLSLIPLEYVNPKPIVESIQRTASHYEDSGEVPQALEDFLFRRRPRISNNPSGPILQDSAELLNGVIDAVLNMDETTLCIQGPPGTGKTYTAGRVILELVQQGKRIGVSANSHKAICNLMAQVLEFAQEEELSLEVVKIGGTPEDHDQLDGYENVKFVQSIKKVPLEAQLIGGTAWAFSALEAVGRLDYLFVDEAGQVSVANLVGMAPSTSNIVLIGDQMQLGQPIQGTHPGESGLSTLEYLLKDKPTIPDDLGIFLSTTWRLHPAVCQFISETVYEGRLRPKDHTAERTLKPVAGATWIDREAGVLFIPVEHSGNTQGSEEEVALIKRIVSELLRGEQTDKDENRGPVALSDILVVAPYNLQTRMLKRALGPRARVGTIDKFQGQEATVVIVSMCASVGKASPRGIEFLFDKNRLNVAISRAKCLAVVVGHPALARTSCSTLRQMELVNLFCRIVTEGRKSA